MQAQGWTALALALESGTTGHGPCGRPTQPHRLSFICFPRSSQYVHLQKTSRLASVPAGDLSSRASSLMPRNTPKLQASAHLTWCCFTKLRTPVELLCTWGVGQDSHFAHVAFLVGVYQGGRHWPSMWQSLAVWGGNAHHTAPAPGHWTLGQPAHSQVSPRQLCCTPFSLKERVVASYKASDEEKLSEMAKTLGQTGNKDRERLGMSW